MVELTEVVEEVDPAGGASGVAGAQRSGPQAALATEPPGDTASVVSGDSRPAFYP